jgi:hypothetical protein
MSRLCPTPIAELLEFDLALHLFLVLVDIIIAPLAGCAAEGDQIVGAFHFCHAGNSSTARKENQPNQEKEVHNAKPLTSLSHQKYPRSKALRRKPVIFLMMKRH